MSGAGKAKRSLRHTALDFLARREYAEGELLQRLLKAGFTQEEILPVLQALSAENLLNTGRFVTAWIDRRRRRGMGPLRIRAELSQKGIPDKDIQAGLLLQSDSWEQAAHEAWQKRFRDALPKDLHERAKQMRFLQGRGFTSEQIEAVFGHMKYN